MADINSADYATQIAGKLPGGNFSSR